VRAVGAGPDAVGSGQDLLLVEPIGDTVVHDPGHPRVRELRILRGVGRAPDIDIVVIDHEEGGRVAEPGGVLQPRLLDARRRLQKKGRVVAADRGDPVVSRQGSSAAGCSAYRECSPSSRPINHSANFPRRPAGDAAPPPILNPGDQWPSQALAVLLPLPQHALHSMRQTK
jgi:hypothetical protein